MVLRLILGFYIFVVGIYYIYIENFRFFSDKQSVTRLPRPSTVGSGDIEIKTRYTTRFDFVLALENIT